VGYCRVRYVSTGTESNDFGRTQRQRAVLNSIFQKVRSKNILQLGLLMNSILKSVNIETDITQTEFNSYLEEAVSLNVKELQNLRIPTDDGYENARVKLGSYNQEVLQIKDWDATRELIRKFIYGEPAGSTADESVDSSDDETTEK
jgi:anionic cell wall polymer biosynthesis LytR-Cps2A-Psr (LCP) family protein